MMQISNEVPLLLIPKSVSVARWLHLRRRLPPIRYHCDKRTSSLASDTPSPQTHKLTTSHPQPPPMNPLPFAAPASTPLILPLHDPPSPSPPKPPNPLDLLLDAELVRPHCSPIVTLQRLCASSSSSSPSIPPVQSFIDALQHLKVHPRTVDLLDIYLRICYHGLDPYMAIGNYLIPLFLDCGSFLDAQSVFNRLLCRNEYTWTCLIQGYAEYGDVNRAFSLLANMRGDDVQPTVHTFTPLLNACAKEGMVEVGRTMHAEIVCKGVETEEFICNSLVGFYAKCGFLRDALELFDQIPARDVVSWNALMTGYLEQELYEDALGCIHEMEFHGISPNAITFVCGLKACSSTRGLSEGQILHEKLSKKGFERNPFVSNALVDMYAKCGAIVEARKVFDDMKFHDIISWNALMGGYAEQNLAEEALHCLQQMASSGRISNVTTFVWALKACTSSRQITEGMVIHMAICKLGIECDLHVNSALIYMYAECGTLIDACETFYRVPGEGVVAWNALMLAHVERGYGEDALLHYEKMLNEGTPPSITTYIYALKACGIVKDKDKGRQVHTDIVKMQVETDPFVGSALIYMYMKCGLFSDSQEVFEKLSTQDIVSWNAMITGCADNGLWMEAIEYLREMHHKAAVPNSFTFVGGLKACANLKAIISGQQIHGEIMKKGFDNCILIGNALVDMYAKCGSLLESQVLFDKAHTMNGLPLNPQELFDVLPSEDIAAWIALTAAYAEYGLLEEAMTNLENLQWAGIHVDALILVYILKSCARNGSIQIGRELHSMIVKLGLEEKIFVGNTLVDMYAKHSLLSEASAIFDMMPEKSVVSWNALISGYVRHGESNLVFSLFEMMLEDGIKPSQVSFLNILTACSHLGLVEMGYQYFESMKYYDVLPTTEIHNCMVNLLSRAGQLGEAMATFDKMKDGPDSVAWKTLLAACQKWGNIELGREAFDCISDSAFNHPATFVLMSNSYLDI